MASLTYLMPLRLPPLSPLRAFEAAGRHQSFKLAARELGLTPSAVSKAVVSLERWLGIELFARGSRGLALTSAGDEYLREVSEALGRIASATRWVPGKRNERTIRVSCAPTFAARLLVPALGRFRMRYPELAVSIDTAHRHVAFPADGFDFAVRMGRGPCPGLRSTRLLGERLVPVCTPAYRAKLTRSRGDATLLHVTSVADDWAAWLPASGAEGLDLRRSLRFDEIQLAIEAASAGIGVAIGRRPLVDRELIAGELVPVLGPDVQSPTAYWLVSLPEAEERSDLSAFRGWLTAEMTRAQT